MKKILLSLLTIGLVGGGVTAATIAYFNSVQTVSANTISTGTLDFVGIIQDTTGSSVDDSGEFSVSNLAPGESFTRCLWVKNDGSVAGRYKIYMTAESGDFTLGNLLTITATLNPISDDCFGLANPFPSVTKYGPDNITKSEWTNVAIRGPFASATTTPFKIESGELAMPGDYYSLFRIIVKLDNSATQQDTSYISDIAIYGMQDAGSLSGSDW